MYLNYKSNLYIASFFPSIILYKIENVFDPKMYSWHTVSGHTNRKCDWEDALVCTKGGIVTSNVKL